MIKKEDIKVGLEFLLPCESIERTRGGFLYYVNTRKGCCMSLIRPTDVFRVKSVKDDRVYCEVRDITNVRVDLDILQKNGFYPEYAEKLMDEWKDSVIASENKNKHATRGLELPVGVISTVVPQNDWIANYSFVGGSRGGNKRNFMSRYLGKFNIPQYENNDELSNEDCKAFKAITDKMSDTYKRKNHDYGNAFSEMYDELSINYGYGKIREKVNRIKTLKDNEAQVVNEPLEDALLDCANYCILTLMEYQKRKEHGTD